MMPLAAPSGQVFFRCIWCDEFLSGGAGRRAVFLYILIGLMVCFLMTSLGELAAYMPLSGSFATYR